MGDGMAGTLESWVGKGSGLGAELLRAAHANPTIDVRDLRQEGRYRTVAHRGCLMTILVVGVVLIGVGIADINLPSVRCRRPSRTSKHLGILGKQFLNWFMVGGICAMSLTTPRNDLWRGTSSTKDLPLQQKAQH